MIKLCVSELLRFLEKMAASKPTSRQVLTLSPSLPTTYFFKDLTLRLGLLPFRPIDLSAYGPVSVYTILSLRSFVAFGKVATTPRAHLVLYLKDLFLSPRYVNSFHGKPAISEFGWSFAPTRYSSLSFATP